jgi:hypothetical protein
MENAIVFTVVFENHDGTPLKYSECCNGEAPETDSPTRYDFLVVDDVGGMKVFGRLVPVP